ncbi:MAG: efflux RND transporter permease subunit [Thermoanaerobaculia bacterium]|nr:efflux RND transporter permease subunit [Thermoanaerobaculia bacterium]MBP9824973.1 efflux RND transporter permease subunit [Thermoanaerobaculia bacterium]
MRLGEFAVRNRATVFFALFAIVVAGGSAYNTLPRESFPDIEIPNILVYTLWPGASPTDVESQITDELERELQGLEGIKQITSTSTESVSVVNVEFVSGVDLDFALQKVRDRVNLAKSEFPADAEEPILRELNFSDVPILQVHLSGDVGPVELRRLAKAVQDEVEAIPGVLRATLVGGVEREVQVDVDPERLRLYGASLDDVLDAIRDENVSIPGGELTLKGQTLALRVPGEVEDPLAVEQFVVKVVGQRPVQVRDVAKVSYGFKERSSYSRIDGRESVSLSVQKRSGSNIIELTDRLKAEVERLRGTWPPGVEATFLADQSKEIRIMVADLENNVLTGVVLVVIVLFFTMGLRNALFVGAAIPLSMLLTFIVVQLAGMTLNMMVLFSLVLAVGMLVDNSIVVVDNIYRHMQEGKSAFEAAQIGTREVGGAVLNSTLTTIGAFVPLFFWPGIIGDFMSILPIAVCIALAASLVIAFTSNPTLAAAYMRPHTERTVTVNDQAGVPADAGLGGRVLVFYRESLAWALGHRGLVLGGTLALFVVVILLYGKFHHGTELFPETDPRQIWASVETPPGTRLEQTDAIVRELEHRLGDLPDIRVRAAATGSGATGDEFSGGRSEGGDPTRGRVTLDLLDMEDRSQSSFATLEEARRRVRGIPGATINVERPIEGPPVGDPLSIELTGDDFARLGEIAERIQREIADIPGLATLDNDFDLARPEVIVRVDRDQAARLGLSTALIARTLRTAINGTEASQFREGEDEWDITVRFAPGARSSLADLQRLVVVNEDGEQIPLETVAEVTTGAALQSIQHKDRRRVVTIAGKVTTPEQAQPVRAEAEKRIREMPNLLPPGYAVRFAGQSEDEEESTAFLSKAFLYALILVLLLIVGQFNSYAVPFIIMTSVAMSMIGVLAGLVLTGTPFGIIMTGIGVISLAGVVVNNAIVLLDYAEQLRARGMARRTLLLVTGMRRLRPVMLTAVTTILGLVPTVVGWGFDFRGFQFQASGESSSWWRPMGVAVMFGLAFATFLTLILVPVLYDLLLEWRERRAGGASRSEDDADVPPSPERVPAG